MKIEDNEGGGESLILQPEDDLRKVPTTHRRLLTPARRCAFRDPPGYFADLAERCPFGKMKQWLQSLLKEDRWELHLHQGEPEEWTMVGFDWHSEKVYGATIGLPEDEDLSEYPKSFQQYFSLVGLVHWNGFGCNGGMGECFPLKVIPADYYGIDIDIDSTYVFGYSPCGDMLIYTLDDRGGWANHGSHQIHLLGSGADTINWVYSELLANRCPEWNHKKWNKERK